MTGVPPSTRFAASVLAPDPKLTPAGGFLLKYSTLGLGDEMLEVFRTAQGGLWIGGELGLTPEGVDFHANAINRFVNETDLKLHIPAGDVTAIQVRRGFGAGIIDFSTPDHIVSFKCWSPTKVRALVLKLFSIVEA